MRRLPLDRDFCTTAAQQKRSPGWLQPDFLHLVHLKRALLDGFARLESRGSAGGPVLDLFCGTRPYRNWIPGSPQFAADIDLHFTLPDVVVREELPFGDSTFSLVVCTQALYQVEHDQRLVDEMYRVLEPFGVALITVPFGHRPELPHERNYSAADLQQLFAAWKSVDIDGFGALGTRLSYNTLQFGNAVARRLPPLAPLLGVAALAANGAGAALDRIAGGKPAIYRIIASPSAAGAGGPAPFRSPRR